VTGEKSLHWPANTKVHVQANVYGLKFADGAYGGGSIHDGSDATKATVNVSSEKVIVDGGFVDHISVGTAASPISTTRGRCQGAGIRGSL